MLELHQIAIYFASVALGAVLGLWLSLPSQVIAPALALMMFATFLQVPLRWPQIGWRFLAALVLGNFLLLPLLVLTLARFLPDDPLIRLGFLLVLLAPCIDYVITFAQMGRADSLRLLAATPVLLVAQMLLLPLYLGAALGNDAALIRAGPFVESFVLLIVMPLAAAWLVQLRARPPNRMFGFLPVPATGLVLFLVMATTMPVLGQAMPAAIRVAPLYAVFAMIAPLIGWMVARWLMLPAAQARAVAFSTGTRNSLVVLPVGLAVPDAIPVIAVVIVAQTLIELLAELVYIRAIPLLGHETPHNRGSRQA